MAAKYVLSKSTDDKFYFNLKAGNHEVILTSQMYADKGGATNGIESCRKNGVVDGQFERKTAKDGSPFFSLNATNGQIIGKSEMYKSEAARDNGIESVKKNAADAELKDKTA